MLTIALSIILGPLVVFAVLAGILFVPLALFILPTAINFAISYLLATRLANHLLPQAVIFLCVSLLLTANVRIPGMVSDAIYERSKAPTFTINKVIEIYEGDIVSVQATADKVESKLNYFQPVEIGGNEGCMCLYFVHPPIEKDDFLKWLKGKGLVLLADNHTEAAVKLVADIDRDEIQNSVHVAIYSKNNKVAEFRDRLRRSFPFEHSENTLINTLIVFSQNTIWSGAFTKDNALPHPVSQFLNQAIKIKESPVTVRTQYLNVASQKTVPTDILMEEAPWLKPDTCSERVRFDTRWHDDDVSKPYHEVVQQGGPGGKDTIREYRGREAGTNVVLMGPDGSEKHVFLRTQEITKSVEATPVKVICGENEFVVLVHFIGVGGDLRRPKEKEENLTFWILKYTYTGMLLEVETFKVSPPEQGRIVFKDFEVATPESYALYLLHGEWPRNSEGKQFRLLGERTVIIEKSIMSEEQTATRT